MSQRAFQIMKGLGLTIVAGAITWLLSWFMQYVASITITPLHPLHISDPVTNRLAVITVLTTVVVMVVVVLLHLLSGWGLFWVLLIFGGSIAAGISSVAHYAFQGTTVSTQGAQWTYGIIVVLWGILMWYIFLSKVTDELAGDDEDDD